MLSARLLELACRYVTKLQDVITGVRTQHLLGAKKSKTRKSKSAHLSKRIRMATMGSTHPYPSLL